MTPVSWWREAVCAGAAAAAACGRPLRLDLGSARNRLGRPTHGRAPQTVSLDRAQAGGADRCTHGPRTKVSSPAPRGERTPCSPRQRAPLQGTLRTDCGLHCGWKAACPPGPLSSRAGWCSRVGAMPTAEASSLALAATCVQNRQRPRPGPRARCAGVAAPRSRRLTGVLRATRQPGCVLPSAGAHL